MLFQRIVKQNSLTVKVEDSHENETSSRETRRDEMAKVKFPQMRSYLVKRYYSEENRLKLLD
jgi:hypothetical protein